ncbi:patatin-like phospholipase family protein [Paenibacillus aurantius]|uniref:Patatin-like phospholipase family protein n=1 Tax=Paenibacillus aurantius TaxID=2918900 RepID=A0AA96LA84_9BACL|nr:patatin-like phospholipase family protein [Paenibacillus aurantius]WNQ09413.1 patatin-like phospholipase family protein [Paenibacillus aurantius]
MEVNAVFQGGGVKAIGLAGAVCEAQRRGIRFVRTAGTSSGSIVAALLAAGYTGEELKTIIMQTPFSSFLQKSFLHEIRWIGPAVRLLLKKGLYSGEKLEQWIYELLAAKGVRTFGDLPADHLKIIASDITQGKLLVLPQDIGKYGIDPNRFTVAKAIRMSTSIPYFFEPVIIRKRFKKEEPSVPFRDQFVYIVDGGILSNFPLWLFDDETKKTGRRLPTLGFQLVGRGKGEPHRIVGPLSMFHALFSTMMDAHDERYIEEHNRSRTIKIPALGVGTTDFSIVPEASLELFESGVKAADKFFCRWSSARYWSMYG